MSQDSSDKDSAFEASMQARTPTRDIFGKLDAEISTIRINSEVLIMLQRRAASLHMTLSEFIRTRLEVEAVGKEHILNMHAEQLDRVCGNAGQVESAPSTTAAVPGPVGLPKFLRQESKT